MIATLEVAADLVLSGAVLTASATVAAVQLGRLATRDADQREVEPRPWPPARPGPDWTPSVGDGRRRPGAAGTRSVRTRKAGGVNQVWRP